MSTGKTEVFRMIQQIRDRLDDVEESLGSYEGDVAGYAERLDRIDDRLFEIEEEFEAPLDPEEPVIEGEADAESGEEEYEPHITRDGVQQTTDNLNSIYKTGVETAAELTGAFSDIKEALDFKSILMPKK